MRPGIVGTRPTTGGANSTTDGANPTTDTGNSTTDGANSTTDGAKIARNVDKVACDARAVDTNVLGTNTNIAGTSINVSPMQIAGPEATSYVGGTRFDALDAGSNTANSSADGCGSQCDIVEIDFHGQEMDIDMPRARSNVARSYSDRREDECNVNDFHKNSYSALLWACRRKLGRGAIPLRPRSSWRPKHGVDASRVAAARSSAVSTLP